MNLYFTRICKECGRKVVVAHLRCGSRQSVRHARYTTQTAATGSIGRRGNAMLVCQGRLTTPRRACLPGPGRTSTRGDGATQPRTRFNRHVALGIVIAATCSCILPPVRIGPPQYITVLPCPSPGGGGGVRPPPPHPHPSQQTQGGKFGPPRRHRSRKCHLCMNCRTDEAGNIECFTGRLHHS